METFDQLTDAEKQAAVDVCTNRLLEQVVSGAIRFNDELNHDDLQARIDAALAKADTMQTPWFAGEYIMERAGDDLRELAECDAESALYAEPDEYVLHGIVKESK